MSGYDQQMYIDATKGVQVDTGFHDFSIHYDTGKDAGTINLSIQKGGKQLYVDMINGINGFGPRDFGPSLMRDLLRQIKAEFPEAESITGHRVSGARDKAGTYNDPRYQAPVVKLSIEEGETAYEKDIKAFREKNNLPAPTQNELVAAMRTRIRQIEYDRRLTGKIEGEPYPHIAELGILRKRVRDLSSEVKLDLTPEGWGKVGATDIAEFQESLENWQQIGKTLMADYQPRELYTAHETELRQAVEAELRRI